MNVLAIGAHSMDILFVCGGTLAKYALNGHAVSLAVMCTADTERPEFSHEQWAASQEREFGEAAAVIGADFYHLGFSTFGVNFDPQSKLRVVEVIRRARPEVIITHDPGDYSADHTVTSQLVFEASFMARYPTVKTETPADRVFSHVVFGDTVSGLNFAPDDFVNITEVMDTKRRMLECHRTEIDAYAHNAVYEWREWMEVSARYRGTQCGARYAEAFRHGQRWSMMSARRILP